MRRTSWISAVWLGVILALSALSCGEDREITKPLNGSPTRPTDPDPQDGAVGVGADLILSWSPCRDVDGDSLTYEVLVFADQETVLTVTGLTEPRVDLTNRAKRLLFESTYSWQVIARDEFGLASEGPRWVFSTGVRTWRPLGSGFAPNGFGHDDDGGDMLATGRFLDSDGTGALCIAEWDGMDWHYLADAPTSMVNCLIRYRGEIIVTPSVRLTGDPDEKILSRWDGTSWWPAGSGLDGMIQDVAVYGDELIVGGYFHHAGGGPADCIASWNGSSWAPLGGGANGEVGVLCAYDGELIAGGQFTTMGGASAKYIAAWDGASWHPLGDGMDASVSSLVVYNGELIAAGTFRKAGGVTVPGIAAWNGQSWRLLGASVNTYGGVRAMCVCDGALVVGGTFTSACGKSAKNIAMWDGLNCSPLGGGLSNTVWALREFRGRLIAGGSTFWANGMEVGRVAQW
jgi:hypothetical protein